MDRQLEISRSIIVPPTAEDIAASPCLSCGAHDACSAYLGWCFPCCDALPRHAADASPDEFDDDAFLSSAEFDAYQADVAAGDYDGRYA